MPGTPSSSISLHRSPWPCSAETSSSTVPSTSPQRSSITLRKSSSEAPITSSRRSFPPPTSSIVLPAQVDFGDTTGGSITPNDHYRWMRSKTLIIHGLRLNITAAQIMLSRCPLPQSPL
ncbi:uncharacterized protein J3R85_002873 [Psidium guajava]|nr:uncharacterized protein J3R85_002873 [Psidium guajava]